MAEARPAAAGARAGGWVGRAARAARAGPPVPKQAPEGAADLPRQPQSGRTAP